MFDIMENFNIAFKYVFTYHFKSRKMIILYFGWPYFHVSNNALFLRSTLVLSNDIEVVYTLYVIK